eukprot:113868_1
MADNHGYWGDITSNYDWCEYNYQFTYYIAEFFNTLSSIPIFMAGLYGLINCIRYKYEYKFYLNNITLMIVGIGSIAFHGTLLREGQILDEIPMLWCSLSMLYVSCTFTFQSNILFVFMILYGIISTFIYFYVSFDVFVIAYIITVASIILSTGIQIRKIKNMNLAKYGILSGMFYAGGFLFLWLPEQFICGNRILVNHHTILTKLQFHAIFHITSTIGPYYFMIYAVMMNYYVLKQNPKIKFHTILKIPVVHIHHIHGKHT